jgi:hypothetical protein
MTDRYAEAETLSEGWLRATQILCRTPGRKVIHLVIRVADPTAEEEAIREAAEALIEARNARVKNPLKHYPPIETTRSTIFPADWAKTRPKPADLAAYYRESYHKELGGLRYFKHNERGTYFGRIVDYPRFGENPGTGDQLTDTVRKLRAELKRKKGSGAKRARYEINIYNERCDTSPMGFPCLAHLAVHLDSGKRLCMQAIYRNEHIVYRGYGNFLGLAELQAYIAAAAGVEVGELLMTFGHAELDVPKTLAGKHLSKLWLALDPD